MQAQDKRMASNANAATIRRRVANRLGFAVLAVASSWALLGAASAQATNVTVGSPLTATFTPNHCATPCTVAISALSEPGAQVNSPIDGAIVNWHMLDGSSSFKYKLRVLTPTGGTTYTGAGTSAAETPSGPSLQTFATSLPIHAGQIIALDLEPEAPIGFVSGGGYTFWSPPLADGATSVGGPFAGELAFNAEVQPPPGITTIGPTSGSISGGTSVLIAGHDLSHATAVSFGNTPASSFTGNSDTALTAIAPPGAGPSTVDVSVTTVAGKTAAVASDRFTYTACVVPKVKGKSLKASRKKLRAAGCALGKVKGKKDKAAKVKKQKPQPGKILAPGSKVSVKLGE